MKRIANKLAIAITSLALVLASCTNSIDGTVGSSDASLSADSSAQTTLNVVATSNDDIVIFDRGDSRTITPGAYKASALNFYLYGSDMISSTSLNDGYAIKVNFVASDTALENEGSVNVDLTVSNYKLYLVAVPNTTSVDTKTGSTELFSSSDALSKAVLFANANVDLRYNQTVHFYLSPNNLSGNSGQIKLTLKTLDYATDTATSKTEWHDYDYFARVSLQKLEDGSIVDVQPSTSDADSTSVINNAGSYKGALYIGKNTALITDATTAPTSVTDWGKIKDDGVVLTYPNVPTGTYNLVAEFIDARTMTKHYYYSEKVLALANQEIEANVEIPNIIGKKPTAPSNLQVGYNDPDNADSDYYLATFQWEDNSNNEEYFVLELIDVSGDVNGWTELGTVVGLSTQATNLLSAVQTAPDTACKSTTTVSDPVTNPYTAWNTEAAVTNAKYMVLDKYVYQKTDSLYAAGSLDKNSTSLSLWLPLGSVYVARLCAYNDALSLGSTDADKIVSDQEWLYANTKSLTSEATTAVDTLFPVYTSTGTDGSLKGSYTPTKWPAVDSTATVATATETNSAPTAISRYRLTYNLNNGKYWEVETDGKLKSVDVGENVENGKETTATFVSPDVNRTDKIVGIDSYNNKIVEYHTLTAAGTALINPILYTFEGNDSTSTTPTSYTATLFSDGKAWTCWKKDSVEGTVTNTSTNSRVFREIDWKEVVATSSETLITAKTAANQVVYDVASPQFAPTYVDGSTSATDKNTYYVKSKYGYIRTTGYIQDTTSIPDADGDIYNRIKKDDSGAYTLALTQKAAKDAKVMIKSSLANYMTFNNLNLFATYAATNADVEIYSPDNYNLETANIRVYKTHGTETAVTANTYKVDEKYVDGTYKDGELNGRDFVVSTFYDKLTFNVVEKALRSANSDIYAKVRLVISKTGGSSIWAAEKTKTTDVLTLTNAESGTYSVNQIGSSSTGKEPLAVGAHTMYSFDVNISSFTSGHYCATVYASTTVNEKNPFTYNIYFEVAEPIYTAFTEATTYAYDGYLYEKVTDAYVESSYSTTKEAIAAGVDVYTKSGTTYTKVTAVAEPEPTDPLYMEKYITSTYETQNAAGNATPAVTVYYASKARY